MMTLQFADPSVKRPYGIVEDVLVKIDKFVFLVHFVILQMPEDEEIPQILGRPFLETGRCMIDIKEGTMTFKVYDEELKNDVRNAMKYKDNKGTSRSVEVLDTMVAQSFKSQIPKLPLERVLGLSAQEIEKEVLAMLEAQPQWARSKPHQWEDFRAPLELRAKRNLKQVEN